MSHFSTNGRRSAEMEKNINFTFEFRSKCANAGVIREAKKKYLYLHGMPYASGSHCVRFSIPFELSQQCVNDNHLLNNLNVLLLLPMRPIFAQIRFRFYLSGCELVAIVMFMYCVKSN